MMTGSVNARREACLPLQVFGPSSQSVDVTTVIDTGYNGTLTLPLAIVQMLALIPDAHRKVRLGDASVKLLSSYVAEIVWLGRRRQIVILCVEGDPLLGTTLLDDSHLGVDFRDGGAVSVQPLP